MEQAAGPREEFPSRSLLALLRAVIALACLLSVLTSATATGHWGVTGAAFLFTAYSLLGLVARWDRRPVMELLGFVLQTIFFLVLSSFEVGGGVILPLTLYFHLLLSTMLVHRWWDTWLVVSLSTGVLAVVRTERTAELLPVVVWLGLLAAVGSIHKFRTNRQLLECKSRIKELSEQVQLTLDAERHKLAGDFHDGPLQTFSSLQMRLEALRRIMERRPEVAAEELRSIQEMAKNQTAELRAFLRGLRPVEVGEAGLVSSIRQVVAEFQKHTGIATTFQSQGSPDSGSHERSLELVQIVCEALNNVQKHSKATRVAVAIRGEGGQVEISVADNGVGFPFSGSYTLEELDLLRRGPLSIQRRVRSLGGRLIVDSRPQSGSSINVQIGS
jgi:signal transduction histidine kinase